MTARRLSRFSAFEAAVSYEPPPLSEARQASLLYAAGGVIAAFAVEDLELIYSVRRRFCQARVRGRAALPHRTVRGELEAFHEAVAAVVAALERGGASAEVVFARVVRRAGGNVGQLMAGLPWLRSIERAAAECMEWHRRPVVDRAAPFDGFVCELAWLWRSRWRSDLAISNRPPVSKFCRFAFAVMRTVPLELRMHVDGVIESDEDTWGKFTQALYRADRRTREFQVDGVMGRTLAWVR